jgi:hypothetical protein
VFYGRAPDSAGHTGIMTMDEARQMAIDFTKLPELLRQNGDAERRSIATRRRRAGTKKTA